MDAVDGELVRRRAAARAAGRRAARRCRRPRRGRPRAAARPAPAALTAPGRGGRRRRRPARGRAPPALANRWLMWLLTVAGETTSRSAISALDRPSAISAQDLGLARRQVVRERRPASAGAGAGPPLRAATTWRWTAGSSAASPRATASIAARMSLRAGVLGQVAARARAQRAEHGLVVGVGGERDHARVRPLGRQPARRLDAVAARHPQVHQHDVGLALERPARPPPRRRRRCPTQLDARRAGRAASRGSRARAAGRRPAGRGSVAVTRAATARRGSRRRSGAAERRPPSSSARSRMPVSP